MNKCFLITTPEYDDTTTYCSKWSKEIIEKALANGIKVVNLNRDEAKKANFEKRMENNKPDFAMLNGHGHSKGVTGQNEEELLGCQLKNEGLTNGMILYARSCDCGAELGPTCVKKSCRAFIGYQAQFSFLYDTAHTTTPERDKTAGYFFRVSNSIPNAILKGNSVAEAQEKADTQLKKEIEYLKTHYALDAQHILPWLLWNKTVRVVLGDRESRI